MEEYCKCYVKANVKCASCDKPFKPITTKEEQIKELRKKIYNNIQDNIIYEMELRELENFITCQEIL